MAHIEIGKRIKMARAEAGWTQQKLSDATAEEFGEKNRVAQPAIAQYERGQITPRGETSDRLFHVLSKAGATTVIAALDGSLGVQGRTEGRLELFDLSEDATPVEWIIGTHVARGYVSMIAGQAGAGKSYLCQTICAALSKGLDHVAGFKLPGKRQRVLYIDAENGKNLTLDRCKNSLGIVKDDYEYYKVAGTKGFDIEKDFARLDAVLADFTKAKQSVDVIVLDSLMTCWAGNVNNAEQVRELLQRLNELAARHNLAVVIIHHLNREGEFYGSFAIQANISGALFLFSRVHDEGPERKLTTEKMRIATEPATHTLYVTGHGITDYRHAHELLRNYLDACIARGVLPDV